MGKKRHQKLNWLQHHLPEGLVVDAAWLEAHGYSPRLRSKYVSHQWLEQVGRGVYRRPPAKLPDHTRKETLQWQDVVASLQTLLDCPVTVGGRTALELQGFSHYLAASGPREIHLYGSKKPREWVFDLPVDATIVYHNALKLFANLPIAQCVGSQASDLSDSALVRYAWGNRDLQLTISTPERAILELLDEVPARETFHQADMLIDGLRTLSPRRLQMLLESCRNVKVKRLFFWFAERHNHAWLTKLDRNRVDLGKGKRMIVRGGKLDPKFNITVPGDLNAGG